MEKLSTATCEVDVVVVFVVSNASASFICKVAWEFVVPIPRLPVEGLKTNFVLEIPIFVVTPDVTSSNVI